MNSQRIDVGRKFPLCYLYPQPTHTPAFARSREKSEATLMPDTILELTGVKTHFPVYRGRLFKRQVGTVKAVDGVDLSIARGEVVGSVGESGCGKSTLARTIMQLVPATAGTITSTAKT